MYISKQELETAISLLSKPKHKQNFLYLTPPLHKQKQITKKYLSKFISQYGNTTKYYNLPIDKNDRDILASVIFEVRMQS